MKVARTFKSITKEMKIDIMDLRRLKQNSGLFCTLPHSRSVQSFICITIFPTTKCLIECLVFFQFYDEKFTYCRIIANYKLRKNLSCRDIQIMFLWLDYNFRKDDEMSTLTTFLDDTILDFANARLVTTSRCWLGDY